MGRRSVKVLDRDGNVVLKFWSVKECGVCFGVSPRRVSAWIKEGTERKGLRVVHDEAVKQKKKKREKEGVDDRALTERLTPEQMEDVVNEWMKKGIVLERIPYELRCGVVCITPCRKRERVQMVGSYGCVGCRNFCGRCKELKTVLCSFRSRNWQKMV